MKKAIAILICSLMGGVSGWAYGPYCGPVPRCGASVYVNYAPGMRVGYYPRPAVVYAAPVVYPAPVVYTPPPAVYVAPAPPPLPPPPVVYQAPVVYATPAPVVYAQPAYCAPPAVQIVAALPLVPFWFGGHHGGWGHGGHYR